MNEARLQEIKKRADEATEGPWEVLEWNRGKPVSWNECFNIVDSSEMEICAFPTHKAAVYTNRPIDCEVEAIRNSQFIGHARQDIPDLIAYIKKLEEEKEAMREALEWACEIMRYHKRCLYNHRDGCTLCKVGQSLQKAKGEE